MSIPTSQIDIPVTFTWDAGTGIGTVTVPPEKRTSTTTITIVTLTLSTLVEDPASPPAFPPLGAGVGPIQWQSPTSQPANFGVSVFTGALVVLTDIDIFQRDYKFQVGVNYGSTTWWSNDPIIINTDPPQ